VPLKPSTVLYVANATKIGGGNRVLMDLMLNLDPARFQPFLVAPAEGPLTDWARAAGVRYAISAEGDWHSSRQLARRSVSLARLLVRERAVIAHASAPTCYRALGFAGRLTRTARVCHLGFPPEPGELRRSFASPPDAVIGCYEAQAAEHAPVIHAMRADCRVVGICNGIDTGRFSPRGPSEAMATLRRGATHVIAILGHISAVKGHPTFIEAAGRLARARGDVRFLVIGTDSLQPGLAERLRGRAEALGIGDRVDFLGFRDDVPDVLSAADVVVLPSRSEGFPLAVLEAMACGKPVIATTVGGVAEAVVADRTGVLIPPDHVTALSDSMARLLDADVRAAMGAAARQRVEERFSVRAFAGAVQRLYATLLDERAGNVGRAAA
jgi:glycosyltransferase involved in cell wall biosynthesis